MPALIRLFIALQFPHLLGISRKKPKPVKKPEKLFNRFRYIRLIHKVCVPLADRFQPGMNGK